jgi:hypothetical protein
VGWGWGRFSCRKQEIKKKERDGEIEKRGGGGGFGIAGIFIGCRRSFGLDKVERRRRRRNNMSRDSLFLFLDSGYNKRLGERLRTVIYSGRYQSIQSFTSTCSSLHDIPAALLK